MRLSWASQTFPHVGHFCLDRGIDILPEQSFHAACFFSATSNHLASASRAPFVSAVYSSRFPCIARDVETFERDFQAVLVRLFLPSDRSFPFREFAIEQLFCQWAIRRPHHTSCPLELAFRRKYTGCGKKKQPPNVFCRFLSNCLEVCRNFFTNLYTVMFDI